MSKIERYLELKEKFSTIKNRPIGDRIKVGGNLERRIKEVFSPERAKQILTRSEDTESAYDEFQDVMSEFYDLREELEDCGVITYNDDGDEIIDRNVAV